MKVRPYVYRCEHKETGRFYIGYRSANKVPADKDLGFYYFTSCKEVRNNFSEYSYEILSEYDSIEIAYETEQVLLYNLRHDPLLINGDNFRKRNHISLDPKPILVVPKERNEYQDRRKKVFSSLPKPGKKSAGNISDDYKNLRKSQKRKRGSNNGLTAMARDRAKKLKLNIPEFGIEN